MVPGKHRSKPRKCKISHDYVKLSDSLISKPHTGLIDGFLLHLKESAERCPQLGLKEIFVTSHNEWKFLDTDRQLKYIEDAGNHWICNPRRREIYHSSRYHLDSTEPPLRKRKLASSKQREGSSQGPHRVRESSRKRGVKSSSGPFRIMEKTHDDDNNNNNDENNESFISTATEMESDVVTDSDAVAPSDAFRDTDRVTRRYSDDDGAAVATAANASDEDTAPICVSHVMVSENEPVEYEDLLMLSRPRIPANDGKRKVFVLG